MPRLNCSFCGKEKHEVEQLIAGPSVFICNECVGLCVTILAETPRHRRSSTPSTCWCAYPTARCMAAIGSRSGSRSIARATTSSGAEPMATFAAMCPFRSWPFEESAQKGPRLVVQSRWRWN